MASVGQAIEDVRISLKVAGVWVSVSFVGMEYPKVCSVGFLHGEGQSLYC